MPLYEYECRACEALDQMVSMAAADETAFLGVARRGSAADLRHRRHDRPAAAPAPVCGQGACGAC